MADPTAAAVVPKDQSDTARALVHDSSVVAYLQRREERLRWVNWGGQVAVLSSILCTADEDYCEMDVSASTLESLLTDAVDSGRLRVPFHWHPLESPSRRALAALLAYAARRPGHVVSFDARDISGNCLLDHCARRAGYWAGSAELAELIATCGRPAFNPGPHRPSPLFRAVQHLVLNCVPEDWATSAWWLFRTLMTRATDDGSALVIRDQHWNAPQPVKLPLIGSVLVVPPERMDVIRYAETLFRLELQRMNAMHVDAEHVGVLHGHRDRVISELRNAEQRQARYRDTLADTIRAAMSMDTHTKHGQFAHIAALIAAYLLYD